MELRLGKRECIFWGVLLACIASFLFLSPLSKRKIPDSGVTVFEPSAVQDGINFAYERTRNRAFLISNSGELLHQWSDLHKKEDTGWHAAELGPDGTLAVVIEDFSLRLKDRDSNDQWVLPGRFHHSVDFTQEGTMLALERKVRRVEQNGEQYRILDDIVHEVSMQGEIIKTRPLFEPFAQFVSNEKLQRSENFVMRGGFIPENSPADIFHANSIQAVTVRVKGEQREAILICSRNLNRIILLDRRKHTILWSFGESILSAPHDATLASDQTVLIFDNGREFKRSRVLEIDIPSSQIVWSLDRVGGRKFFSSIRGSAQRLENGNTLVSVFSRGFAFEVTPEKEMVWAFRHRNKKRRPPLPVLRRVKRDLFF